MIVCALYCVLVFGKFYAIAFSRGKCNDKCCTHFVKKNELCIECQHGTYRENLDDQNTCIPCPEGKYGYRCAQTCKCTISTHTCDSVDGRCCCRITANNCVEDNSCRPKVNDWLLLGLPCGVVVFAVTVISSILIRILKSRRVGKIEIPLNDIVNFTNDAGSSYEYIDENMMVNLQKSAAWNISQTSQILRSDSNSSGSTDACNGEEHDGYLNPHIPPAEGFSYDGDDLNEDLENGGYLNPYQPLTLEWQKHAYVYDRGDEVH